MISTTAANVDAPADPLVSEVREEIQQHVFVNASTKLPQNVLDCSLLMTDHAVANAVTLPLV